jgi:hypothetical protein
MAHAIRPMKPLGAQLYDGVRGLPGPQVCNAIYAALADKVDVSPEALQDLSNRIGRLAHEKGRTHG